ncbi:hypothetical protein GP486_002330 [Trichoglossum hirsutum]|uniref:Myb-like domain-containing protein n=1 Tax=Trichoglossum hirsutum TaxID=265104 RepID=A0A9P8LFA5_9PEZI|nr:hypothetical protein GP486_002330 [Trichoglossum hirsutum]
MPYSWSQPPANSERRRGNPARIGRLFGDYQQENIGSESGWRTSDSISQSTPLSNVPSQTNGHDADSRSQRHLLGGLDHSKVTLDMTEPRIGMETLSIRDSKVGAHGTNVFGQDAWETSPSIEHSWCSSLAVPYSIFEESISQCYSSNNQSSNIERWTQRQENESDGQPIKIEPTPRLDGQYFPSFCGNWMDSTAVVGQHYSDLAGVSVISPGSLGGFQDPPVRCLGLLEDSLHPGPISIGRVAPENGGKISFFPNDHRANTSSQSRGSGRKAEIAAAEPFSNSHFGNYPKIEGTLHDPLSIFQQLGNQTTGCARPEVQYHQQNHPLNQTSSIPLALNPVYLRMPGDEQNKHLSPEPRPARTRRSLPRRRINPSTRTAQWRIMKDQFLIESKLAGMSYKEIREMGNFSEAESTLRGRFRTLTKDKGERVRRPEWGEEDVISATPQDMVEPQKLTTIHPDTSPPASSGSLDGRLGQRSGI